MKKIHMREISWKKLLLKNKKIIIWIILMMMIIGLYNINPGRFDIRFLQGLLENYKILAVLIYIFILSIIGLFFIPSTPFAIAGVLLFGPVEAYIYNLIGIISSSIIVYYFTKFLGLERIFKKKYPKQIEKLSLGLDNNFFPVMIGWSLFPFVPTDLMIYIASTLRIPLWKCLLGVIIGEGLLNAFYIFGIYGIMK